jgi:hypothetical protein
MTALLADDTGLPQYAQGILGGTLFVAVSLLIWGFRHFWAGWRTYRETVRKDKKEEKTDEYDLRKQEVGVVQLELEQDISLAKLKDELWREQYAIVKEMLQTQFAENRTRETNFQQQLSRAIARIDVLEQEKDKCEKTTTAQTAEIAILKAHNRVMLSILRENGLDKGLAWIDPAALQTAIPTPPQVTTVNVNVESRKGNEGVHDNP